MHAHVSLGLTFESTSGNPGCKHDVELSWGTPLGLRKVEKCDDNAACHPAGKDEICLRAEVATAKRLVSSNVHLEKIVTYASGCAIYGKT
jgi:hypothetical protein